MNPFYTFDEFKEACRNKQVIPINDVLSDANNYFNLKNLNEILEFIENDGLENLKFINTALWKNNKAAIEIMVDAYEFTTLGLMGYIAFFNSPIAKKWIIKSFHISQNSNSILRDAFQKAGISCDTFKLIEETKNEK